MKLRARPFTDRIIIHCSATSPEQDIGVAEIDRWHKGRGWHSCGYHFVIRRDGTLEYGREITKEGAHARGYNRRSVGICLIGGIDDAGKPEANFTEEQMEALERLVPALKLMWPEAIVIGHNEVSRKACPSFDVQEWLESLVPLEPRKPDPGAPWFS